MKATNNHISLETAKPLKDCGVESMYVYLRDGDYWYADDLFRIETLRQSDQYYCAYSWQEILWEHADKFFENTPRHQFNILLKLQAKNYDLADLYFRQTCILLSQT